MSCNSSPLPVAFLAPALTGHLGCGWPAGYSRPQLDLLPPLTLRRRGPPRVTPVVLAADRPPPSEPSLPPSSHYDASPPSQPPPPPLQLLSAAQRLRANSAPDTEYYTHPRLLPAVTPAYAARLASLYASVLSGGEVVLELGASWDSYLPPAGPPPAAVMGLGLNAVEMGRNAALTAWVVKDLNAAPGAEARDEDVGGGVEAAAAAADAAVAGGGDVVAAAMAAASAAAVSTAERTADGRVVPPSALDSVHPDGAVSRLPWPSASYDAVLCNATVAYLARPEGVFAEVGRLLAPGGVAVFAWSDALFFDKAIAGWMAADPPGRLSLVKKYLSVGAGLEVVQTVAVGAPREAAVTHRQMQALGREAAAEEPFYAVVARKPGGGGGL